MNKPEISFIRPELTLKHARETFREYSSIRLWDDKLRSRNIDRHDNLIDNNFKKADKRVGSS